ncbi:MAG: cytochrome c biogenesis protein CcsA [Anaerolineae bacterium]|nr:cytochrome c biogenesis protein CcsA [Anaerolineae bacterium]
MSAVLPTTTQPAGQTATRSRVLTLLSVITAIAVAFGFYLAVFAVGQDATQGDVQRIFYLHVSAFAGAFVALGATVVGGLAYLRTRNPKWDTLAVAGVEVGLILAIMNLVTGAIWARPIWNTWWTWDPRLTSDAIMCLTYAAYLMLRQGIENPDTSRRFAAVYGILAFSTAIITLMITRIRPDTIHPVVIGNNPESAEGSFSMTVNISTVMSYNMVVWSVLVPWALVWWRIRLENLNLRVKAMRARLMES